MCEFTEIMKNNKWNWNGQYLYQIVGQDLVERPPFYHVLEPGRCMLCGTPLDYNYMRNMGCTKSLCESCYQHEIVHDINGRCVASGYRLPAGKIQEQYRNPREVRTNILEGEPLWKWAICHSKVVGEDMSWLADEQERMQQEYQPYQMPQQQYNPYPVEQHGYDPDVVDAEFEDPHSLYPGVMGALTEGKPLTRIDFRSTNRPEKVTIDKAGNIIPKKR